jgi:hypothetical protein
VNIEQTHTRKTSRGCHSACDGVRNIVILQVEENPMTQARNCADSRGTLGREKLFAYLVGWGETGKLAGDGESLAQVAKIQGDDQPVAY